MIKCSSSKVLDKIGNCVLIYVYNRILENVIDDVVIVNEIIVTSFLTLSTRSLPSSPLDICLNLQSGDQVFRNIHKYFQVSQRVHYRWLDVVRAAIELDISLSIEETLLSASAAMSDRVDHKPIEMLLEGKSKKVENDINEEKLSSISSCNSIREDCRVDWELFDSTSSKGKLVSSLNPEIIVQEFESRKEIPQTNKIKNVSFWCTSSLNNVPMKNCLKHLIESDNRYEKKNEKVYLFVSSQLLLRATDTFLGSSTLQDKEIIEEENPTEPVFLAPLIQQDSNKLLQAEQSERANCTDEPYFGSKISADSISRQFFMTDEETYKYDNDIKFFLPVNSLSDSHEEIKRTIVSQIRHVSISSWEFDQENADKTDIKTLFEHDLQPEWKHCGHESIQEDIILCETESLSNHYKSFILEQEEIGYSLNITILISDLKFSLYNNFSVLTSSTISQLSLPLFNAPNYFSESEIIQFSQIESIKSSELLQAKCDISPCLSKLINKIQCENIVTQNSKDISYLSCFRSFSNPIRLEILRNRDFLPCSKEFRMFSTSFPTPQCNVFVKDSKKYSKNNFTRSLNCKMVEESKALQLKCLLLPQFYETNSSLVPEITLSDYSAPIKGNPGISSPHSLESLYHHFLQLNIQSITISSLEKLRLSCKSANAIRNSQSHGISVIDKTLNINKLKRKDKKVTQTSSAKIGLGDRTFTKLSVPLKNHSNLAGPDTLKALMPYKNLPKIDEEIRCLNLVVYFLEELFDIWADELVTIEDVRSILQRLFDQLKIILLRISRKQNNEKLTDICNSCVNEIYASMHYAFDPICILLFLKSIVHKLNMFGKYISFSNIIPMSLKYALYKLYLHYKSIMKREKNVKLHTCLIEVIGKPEVLNELFFSPSSDRRIKLIEKKAKCCMVLQPIRDTNDQKRIIKVYYMSHCRNLNVKALITMIGQAIEKPYNKIQISSIQSLPNIYDATTQKSLKSLGDVKWINFKYI